MVQATEGAKETQRAGCIGGTTRLHLCDRAAGVSITRIAHDAECSHAVILLHKLQTCSLMASGIFNKRGRLSVIDQTVDASRCFPAACTPWLCWVFSQSLCSPRSVSGLSACKACACNVASLSTPSSKIACSSPFNVQALRMHPLKLFPCSSTA